MKVVTEKHNRGEDQGGRSEMKEAGIQGWACCLTKLKQEEGEGGWKGISEALTSSWEDILLKWRRLETKD